MQETIGDKLQQARKRLGISLEEASAKTKIRMDFLARFEQGDINIPLPEIYRKGFLKNYARFLRLNPQVILNEYFNLSFPGAMEGSDFKPLETEVPLSSLEPKPGSKNESESYVKPLPQFVYFRPLVWGVSVFIVLLLFIGGIKLRSSKKAVHLANQEVSNVENLIPSDSITLIGLNNVQVFVRQEEDKKRLFADTISKGDRCTIRKTGSVQISYSEGANLLIERSDGSQIKPQKAGRGWIKVP